MKLNYVLYLGTHECYKNNAIGTLEYIEFLEYFYYFNILHEIGHVLCKEYGNRILNSKDALNQVEQELLVNQFTVSFWCIYGVNGILDKIKSQAVKEILEFDKVEELSLINTCENSVFKCHDYRDFYKTYARTVWPSNQLVFTGNERGEAIHTLYYSNFQNHSIISSIADNLDINDVLPEMGIKNFNKLNKTDVVIPIPTIETNLLELIENIRIILSQHNINLPDIKYFPCRDKFYNCIESNTI